MSLPMLPACVLTLSGWLYMMTTVAAQTGPGIPCFCLQELDQPISTSVAISNADDGSGRLFVAEQRGVIWIFQNGTKLPEPFLNITDLVVNSGSTGLHSVAFHPDHVNNGLVYIYYTRNSTTGEFYNTVFEYTISGSDPNKVDPETDRFVFEIQCGGPTGCHNGGAFLFGSDNYLYIGHGDEGCCGDDPNHGQNKSNHLAAVHRIDVDTRTGNLPYGIPPDNPFLAEPNALPEMYAYGFRQPYEGSMDRGDPSTGYGYGRIFIGDVGDKMWEEIDILEHGGNFGWAAYEGPMCFKPELCDTIGAHILPVASYNHTAYGQCVISGDMYRGSMIPDLNGWFLYADCVTGLIFGMYEAAVDQWESEVIPVCTTCPGELTNQFPPKITCMGASEDGEQYLAAANTTGATDMETRIFRVSDPGVYELHGFRDV